MNKMIGRTLRSAAPLPTTSPLPNFADTVRILASESHPEHVNMIGAVVTTVANTVIVNIGAETAGPGTRVIATEWEVLP